MRNVLGLPVCLCLIALAGCALAKRQVKLPSHDKFSREQLRIFSDFKLPRRHRLIDELTARRRDISAKLLLPMSDEPINIYIFEDADRYKEYLTINHPTFPERRAFFVKNDTDLTVFAHWSERVGEDLRHEVTHGYLHAVVPVIPLWLDEGLAEYFEVPRGRRGFNRQHIFHLATKVKQDEWRPNLQRLETLADAHDMTQMDYAESWLWAHFLLESGKKHQKLVQDQLARLRMIGEAEPLSAQIDDQIENASDRLLEHLADLAEQL